MHAPSVNAIYGLWDIWTWSIENC